VSERELKSALKKIVKATVKLEKAVEAVKIARELAENLLSEESM
jgi:hypothetical protein